MTLPSFEIFFSLSLDLMVVASTDGYFKRVNPAFVKVLGYSEHELLSQPYASFVHPDDITATTREVRNLAAGIDTLYFENRYRRKDGDFRLLAWTCPAPQPGDTLLYGVARDITEARARENARDGVLEQVRESLLRSYKTAGGVLPICSFCRNVRAETGEWEDVEHYFAREAGIRFSGAYCSACARKEYPELFDAEGKLIR